MYVINEIRKIPFFRLIIPFIAGILFQITVFADFYLLLGALIIFVFFTGIHKYFESKNPKYHSRWIYGILMFASLFFTGAFITAVDTQTDHTFTEYDLFTAKIIEPVKETDKTVKAILKITSYKTDSTWQPADEKVIVYFPKDSLSKQLQYGDVLVFSTRFHEVKNRGNPYEFDYEKYLANRGIYYQTYINQGMWQRIAENQANPVYAAAYTLRKKLLSIYKEQGIEGDEFSVLAALTLGVKDFLSEDITQSYAATGAMHVLAVSGLHVGIIYLILNSLLFFMQRNKWLNILKAIILIAFIWLFAFITGLSPSVRRASLMLSLIIIGQISGRHPSIYNSIAVSAFLILLINPLTVLQVGFQLSYAAVIAIVYFQPKIYRIFEVKNWFLDKIWALIAVSLAAQIGTFPISIYYFHKFPVYFFLSNIVVIPAAYLIISLAIALLLFNKFSFVAGFFAILLKYVLGGLNYLTKAIENLPFSSINHISFSFIEIVLLYFLISIWIIYFINYRRNFVVFGSLVLLLLFFVSRNYRFVNAFNRQELVVFNAGNASCIGIKNNDVFFVYTDSSFLKEKNYKYLTDNYISHQFIDEVQLMDKKSGSPFYCSSDFFLINGLRIAILDNKHFTDKASKHKLNVDLLIISGSFNANIEPVLDLFDFDELVLDASLKKWQTNAILRDCAAMNIFPYDVREQGAYVLDLK